MSLYRKESIYLVIDLHLDKTRRELQMMRLLAGATESHLRKELSEFESWLDSQVKQIEKEHKDELYEFHWEEHSMLRDEFPRIHRNSIFLALYALFEARLNDYCRYLEAAGDVELKLSDLADKGVRRAQTYLTKVAGVEFPSTSKTWLEILTVGKLRNLIAHSEGKLTDDTDKALLRYIDENKLLSRSQHGGVQLGSDYSAYLAERFERFFNELHKLVLKAIDT